MEKGAKVTVTTTVIIDGVEHTGTVGGFTVDHVNADGSVRLLYPNGFTCGYAHADQVALA